MPDDAQQINVVGASGGIGRALVVRLLDRFPKARIAATHYRGDIPFEHDRIAWQRLDIRDPGAIAAWSAHFSRVDWLLNCAGYLHGQAGGPEKNIGSLEADFLLENVRVNTLPTLLLAKHFSAPLKTGQAFLGAPEKESKARPGNHFCPRRQHRGQPSGRLVQLPDLEGGTQYGVENTQYRMETQPPARLHRGAASGH